MTRLVKYCRREHNPSLGSASLQLGTFAYYRSMDPSFAIADPGEATHTVRFKEGTELNVDPGVSQRLFGGAVSASGGDLTMIAGPGAHFQVQVANAYIFCASRTTDQCPPSLDRAREYDPNYDSIWEITDPRQFRDVVGAALLEVLTLNHLSPLARATVSELPLKDLTLQVNMLDQPVEYVDSREHQVDGSEAVAKIPDYNEELLRAIFRKERRDEAQQEHRFVYLVGHPKIGVLSVNTEPVRIPLNRLAGAIACVAP